MLPVVEEKKIRQIQEFITGNESVKADIADEIVKTKINNIIRTVLENAQDWDKCSELDKKYAIELIKLFAKPMFRGKLKEGEGGGYEEFIQSIKLTKKERREIES